MRVFSWFREMAILVVLAVVGVSDSHAFQNLDFETTWYPVDSYGVFDPCWDCYGNLAVNPAAVMPGWTLSTELFDGTPVPEPYTLHGVLIEPGHIGGTTEFHLTDASVEWNILEGKHSLSYRAGKSVDFASLLGDVEIEGYPLPGDGYAYPVVSQKGIIPPGTESVTMLVRDYDLSRWPIDGSSFTVRFDGYEVEMRSVDIAEFPDVNPKVNRSYIGTSYEVPHGHFFAGNIEPLGFSNRTMSIRPERLLQSEWDGDQPFMLLDAISFSTFPAPGPPIQLPEPNAALLITILLFTVGSWRARFI